MLQAVGWMDMNMQDQLRKLLCDDAAAPPADVAAALQKLNTAD